MATKKTNKAIKNALAAVAGGAGGALCGGLLVRAGVAPTTAAVGITVAGGAGALFLKGPAQVAALGAGAAGAGQLALAWLAKQDKPAAKNDQAQKKKRNELPEGKRNELPEDVVDAFEWARQRIALEDEGREMETEVIEVREAA
jgi:hypothetical protein